MQTLSAAVGTWAIVIPSLFLCILPMVFLGWAIRLEYGGARLELMERVHVAADKDTLMQNSPIDSGIKHKWRS